MVADIETDEAWEYRREAARGPDCARLVRAASSRSDGQVVGAFAVYRRQPGCRIRAITS
jgi:hypothetical protein